ncbi:MAG: tyrosine-type recombinase/integrase [Phycisphaerae bacterium]|nr:tyrosine-type recombinase/integrase [Phycisphaerae bacterium]
MASLSRDKQTGSTRILFVATDGKRKTVRFGKLTQKQADSVKLFMEDLIGASVSGSSPKNTTAEWIAGLPDGIRKRIERVGLIEPRERKECPTLGQWIKTYIASRTDVKPNTRLKLGHGKLKLIECFGEKKLLNEFNAGDAERFRIFLKQDMAEGSVRRLCKLARQFFTAAVDREIIPKNPFAAVKCGDFADVTKMYFVSLEETQAVIDACPDAEWRLIVALARYGGVRCPSEVLRLKWEDINWAKSRFTVHASKTEHHTGGGVRVVPIFPELLPYLEDCFKLAKPGTEYVITRYRDTRQNLRTTFIRIIEKAGLKPWPKPFQNLRSSRETELTKNHPLHVVVSWIGNSQPVAMKHYLQTTEEDFEKAAQNPAQYTSEMGRIGWNTEPSDLTQVAETTEYGLFPNIPNLCNCNELKKAGLLGIEPRTF